MDNQQTTPEIQQGDVPNIKTQKTRRNWRKFEEDALIKIMIKEISDKWTADNGFRPGFFILLEKELEKVLPGSNLKASPHIESKGHPKRAKFVEGKRFPYYEQWRMIFGKDRATGAVAEDPTEMEEPIPINPANAHVDVEYTEDDPYYPYLGAEFYTDSTPIVSTPMGSTGEGSTPPSSTPMGSKTEGSTPPVSSTPTGSTRRTSLPTSSPLAPTSLANAGAKKGKKRTRMGDEVSSILGSMDNYLKGSLGIWTNWWIRWDSKKSYPDVD
ncbi:hypothetical protein Dimus_003949 [Dionaea muscipula]